jgi:uncharacterized protein (DUF1501 family)
MNCQDLLYRNCDPRQVTRRWFFEQCGVGLGRIALAGLFTGALSRSGSAAVTNASESLIPKKSPYKGRAKAVIHLFMAGAPSHLDLFDHKPKLAEFEGQPIPPSIIGGQRYAFIRSDAAVLGPRFRFVKRGDLGTEIADILPHFGKIVDEVCLIRSMHTDQFNHAPAQIFLNTGAAQPGRPSLGSWVVYGLGAQTSDLPAFVVMSTGSGISGGAANWSSGMLPTVYTGVRFRNQGDPILDVSRPAGVSRQSQRDTLDLVETLDRRRLDVVGDPEIATRIASYEMADRLEASAPELMNLRSESRSTLEMYGADPDKPSFARACLLARRMVERGVRFINIYHEGWDAHSDLNGNHRQNCAATDQGSAALVRDLKQRGLLDETLVIWGGEFGRTPMVESHPTLGRKLGRDHHPQAFTMWMAGGGIKPGITFGKTDDLGFHVVENGVHVHDLQATILHVLGFDHERLTFRHAGRDFRLTDVSGNVVRPILA